MNEYTQAAAGEALADAETDLALAARRELAELGFDEETSLWLTNAAGVKDHLVVRGMVDGALWAEAREVIEDDDRWRARGEAAKQVLARLRRDVRRLRREEA